MIVRYEDSFDGLLSAIAFCWRRELVPEKIERQIRQISLVYEETVPRERDIGQKFRTYLTALMGGSAAMTVLETCWQSYLSEKDSIGTGIYQYLLLAKRIKTDPAPRYNLPEVNLVAKAAQSVGSEAHRFQGLLRFREFQDGLYLAEFTPDYNILPMILPHFADRFHDQEFLIRDLRRDLAAIHLRDGRWTICHLRGRENSSTADSDSVLKMMGEPNMSLSAQSPQRFAGNMQEDELFSRIWSEYLRHLSIPQRKNLALQKQNLPLKYRCYLPEFRKPEEKKGGTRNRMPPQKS